MIEEHSPQEQLDIDRLDVVLGRFATLIRLTNETRKAVRSGHHRRHLPIDRSRPENIQNPVGYTRETSHGCSSKKHNGFVVQASRLRPYHLRAQLAFELLAKIVRRDPAGVFEHVKELHLIAYDRHLR